MCVCKTESMEKEGLFACCIPPVHSHSKQKNIKNKTKQNRITKLEKLSEWSCQKVDKIEYFCSIHNYFKTEQGMWVLTSHNSSE